MPTDWKTNSITQTRDDFVLQHLSEKEIRSFWVVLPLAGGEEKMSVPDSLHCGWDSGLGDKAAGCALSLPIRAQFTSLCGCFVSISHKWTLKRHEASLNPMSLVCAGSCHCILQLCCQWKCEIDPRPATKPLSCWHFNCFIPGGSQLCGCECLIHQTLQASHFQ